ncbi:MAG: metal ABC transporter permease [Bacteroidetes bacterium]|nr:metal ABC transporter permease [Bacteroidota bacterium]
MEIISQVLEFFPYAIIGSIIAGIICSLLGTFVVTQRVVFLGAVLTQVAVAGVAFSFLHLFNISDWLTNLLGGTANANSFQHHFDPAFYSLLFAIIVVLIFSQTHRQKILTQDSILGIIFVTAISARIMFIQKSPVAEVSEIEAILKGDLLFIGQTEVFVLLGILLFTIAVFTIFSKQLKFVTFDSETARAHGINSHFWLLLFYIVVGIGISLTTRFVGDVFTFAYLIIPSVIGIMLAKSVRQVIVIAMLVGAILPPVSLFLAFKFDFSSGPTAVVSAFIIFIIVYIYQKIFK